MSEPFIPTTQKGAYANAVAWVLGILAIVGIVAGITFGVRWLTAPVKGKLQAREQINSGAFRIAAYNHFFDLCASIQGLEGQLAAQRVELATSTGDDKARVEANIAGIQGARQQAIAEYNADAQKSYTIGQFRASGLPFALSPATEVTSCVASSSP